jgi:hypothetical protein
MLDELEDRVGSIGTLEELDDTMDAELETTPDELEEDEMPHSPNSGLQPVPQWSAVLPQWLYWLQQ